jgi:hypothetical protein
MTEEGLVDADAIAILLNIPRNTVLDLARRQLIPSYRFSRKLIQFDKAEVCATADDKLKINARLGRRPGSLSLNATQRNWQMRAVKRPGAKQSSRLLRGVAANS